jgi:hypothetical protein
MMSFAQFVEATRAVIREEGAGYLPHVFTAGGIEQVIDGIPAEVPHTYAVLDVLRQNGLLSEELLIGVRAGGSVFTVHHQPAREPAFMEIPLETLVAAPCARPGWWDVTAADLAVKPKLVAGPGTLFGPLWAIEVAPGWAGSTQQAPPVLWRPDADDAVQISFATAQPGTPEEEAEAAVLSFAGQRFRTPAPTLRLKRWEGGGLTGWFGVQEADGSRFREWFLREGTTLLFATHVLPPGAEGSPWDAEVDAMVRSLRLIEPG